MLAWKRQENTESGWLWFCINCMCFISVCCRESIFVAVQVNCHLWTPCVCPLCIGKCLLDLTEWNRRVHHMQIFDSPPPPPKKTKNREAALILTNCVSFSSIWKFTAVVWQETWTWHKHSRMFWWGRLLFFLLWADLLWVTLSNKSDFEIRWSTSVNLA